VVASPGSFVPVDVRLDLARPRTERRGVAGELGDLPGFGVEGVPLGGQGRAKVWVGHHGGVPDPVDRLQAVAHSHGVQPPPCTGSEDAGVDLEVQVPVGVPGP
jgi:hypothetical protein